MGQAQGPGAQAPASPLPSGASVISGSVDFRTTPTTLTVDQSTRKAIINWSNFSIAEGNTVNFNNGTGVTLNRVLSNSPVLINGFLNATGSVYVIGPGGVIVGKQGVVRAGGTFVASSLDIEDESFLSGSGLRFSGDSTAQVLNLGRISSDNGDVALNGADVENQGELLAPNGTVAMAAGSRVLLSDDRYASGGLLTVEVGGSDTRATNAGLIDAAAAEIKAHGGNIFALAGNGSGVIRATGVENRGGRILLISEGGATSVAGAFEASGPDGRSGEIETSGKVLTIGDATVDAHGGTWLLDPTDLTIDAIAATSVSAALNAGTNVTQQTTTPVGAYGLTSAGNGDIFITAPITWSGAGVLTLDAYRSVLVQSNIQVNGAGGVVIRYNDGGTGGLLHFATGASLQFSGSSPSQSLSINGQSYQLVASFADLVTAITLAPAGRYALAKPLDASGTTWTQSPIAQLNLNGVLDGLGNSISGLTINAPTVGYVGLLSDNLGTVRNLSLVSGSVTGLQVVGALAGHNVGLISDVYSDLAVSGGNIVGGLVGMNDAPTSQLPATITRSTSNGTVTATSSLAGGITGVNLGVIRDSQANGAVSGNSVIGGITGKNQTVFASLVNVVATGSVTGSSFVGGIIGANEAGGTITNALSTGLVTGGSFTGGLAGRNLGTISNAYWDTQTSGRLTSSGGTGLTTVQLKTGGVSGFTGGFGGGTSGSSYPFLTALVELSPTGPFTRVAPPPVTPISWSVANASSTYGTLAILGAATLTGVAVGDVSNVVATVGLTTSGGAPVTLNARLVVGSYLQIVTGLTGSAASSYSLATTGNIPGTLIVRPLALTATLSPGSSVYGAALTPGTLTFTNLLGGDVVTGDPVGINTAGLLSTSGHLIAGFHPGIQVVGTALFGADAGNYTFAGMTGDYTVTRAALTAGLTGLVSRTYDGTTTATLAAGNYSLSGMVSGDGVALNNPTTGSYDTRHAGSGKTVTVSGLALTGADAANYTVASSVSGAVGRIDPLALTATLSSGTSVYGSALTPGTLTFTNVVSGDAVTGAPVVINTAGQLSTSGHLTAGFHPGIQSVGTALGGADAGNYSFAGMTGDYTVTRALLTASLTGLVSRTYDGTTAASLAASNYGLTGAVGGDAVGLNTPTSGTYDTRNAGIGKTVTVNGLVLTGADAGNYTVASSVSGAVGRIDRLTLTATLTAGSSVYGAALSPGTLTFTNVVSGDTVTGAPVVINTAGQLSTSGHLTAGLHPGIQSVGTALGGADAGNYSFGGITGDYTVTRATLTASLVGVVSRTYDGTTAATLGAANYNLSGVVSGDGVALNNPTTGVYDSRHAGSGKIVTVSGLVLTGADAANYTVAGSISGAVGRIDRKALTVSLTGVVAKTFDGTVTATLTSGNYSLSGMLGGDGVGLNGPATGVYDSDAVGSGKTVTVTGLVLTGADADNYAVASLVSGAVGRIDAPVTPISVAALAGDGDPFGKAQRVEPRGPADISPIFIAPDLSHIAEWTPPPAPATSGPSEPEPTQLAAAETLPPATPPAVETAQAPAGAPPPTSSPARSVAVAGPPRAAASASAPASAGARGQRGQKSPSRTALAPPPRSGPRTVSVAERTRRAAVIAAAARKAAARGNEGQPGDSMRESFHDSVWLDNSTLDGADKSRGIQSMERSQSLSSLMSWYLFFLFP